MSEGDSLTMPGVLQCPDDDVVTVNIFNNDEDVDLLKAKLKESSVSEQKRDHNFHNENHLSSDSKSDADDYCSTSDDLSEHKLNSNSSVNELKDSLHLSTETLIDKVEPHFGLHTGSGKNIHTNETPQLINKHKRLHESQSDSVLSNDTGTVSSCPTKVTSGLLISPSSLTQDVHVSMKEDKQRMSAVLDSLDLHLVYIPTTQQLVARKPSSQASGNSSSDSGVNNGKIGDKETDSLEDASCSGNQGIKGSPIKMSDSNSVHSIRLFSPGIADDNSSVNESECLIHIRDVDNNSCDTSEYVCNFPHVNTNDSLLRTFTDASSLSSLSTGTDFSISAASLDDGEGTGHCIDTGDGGFMEINLHSRNSFERGKNPSLDSGFEDKTSKPKRKGIPGIPGILSRGIFSRKSKESNEDEPGWKLFGKIPPKQASVKNPNQIETEYKAKHLEDQAVSTRAKKEDIEVMSTTALILENRPMNLPCKNKEELERHQKEYEAMVEAAKRKEQKQLKLKKKQKQRQLRQEEQLMAAARVWNKEILPNWDVMKNSKKTRELWWHGIPTNVRGKVWKLAIGNDLNITSELYEICVIRAADKIKQMDELPVLNKPLSSSPEPASSKESSVELIKLDVSRTFPQLCIFQKGGPYHDLLHSLLGAYACYRPDVGYVQGMSFIAAVLLLNMDVAEAFICFANLLNHPCQVAFFRVDEGLMKVYFQTFEMFFAENLPTLQLHFKKNNLTPDLYLYDWIFTLFTKSLPLDIACRVWDIFCRDGEEFLFRTALGILKCHEHELMQMDFIHLAQFLTKLPEQDSYDNLFRCIECIQTNIDKKKFSQVLASIKDSKDST